MKEDLSLVPLERLGRYWPAELRAPIAGLGVATVGELLKLSPLDVITAPGSFRGLLSALKFEICDWAEVTDRYTGVTEDDVDVFLARPGFTRPLSAARATPETSWGGLYACWEYPEDEEEWVSNMPLREISAALEAIYAERGLVVSRTLPECGAEDAEHPSVALDARAGREGDPLAHDVVLLDYACDCDDWYNVYSRRWGISPPGRNPLALALSTRLPVIAIAGVAERYTELAIYRGGRLDKLGVHGTVLPAGLPDAAPIDADVLRWLSTLCRSFPVPPAVLATRLGDADALAHTLGLDARGYAWTFQDFQERFATSPPAQRHCKVLCTKPRAPG